MTTSLRVARPRRLRGTILAVLALLVAAALVAWGIIDRQDQLSTLRDVADDQSVPKVQLIQPAHGPATRSLDLPGTIQAWYTAPIYAQVSGYVKMWYKDYGAPVKAGDLLAVIDAPSLDEQFAATAANLEVAQARYKLAEVTAGRWKALAGTQAVAQQEVDVQVANAAAEKAQVDAATHQMQRYQALEQFKNIVAPFDGVVTSRNTDVGSFVNGAGGDVSARGGSTELFSVSDIHRLRVFVSVPQDYSAILKPGLTATLELPQHADRSFKAEFLTAAQAFNAQSRTVVTELTVANPDHMIWPGSYTDVHFQIPSDPDILIVPSQALLFRAAGAQVVLVGPDGVAHLHNVTLGLNLGETVQVVAGLKASDRLINNPSAGLLDGQKVEVVQGAQGLEPAPQFDPSHSSAPSRMTSAQRARVEAARAGTSE